MYSPSIMKIVSVCYEIILRNALKSFQVFSENSCQKHCLPYVRHAVLSYRTLKGWICFEWAYGNCKVLDFTQIWAMQTTSFSCGCNAFSSMARKLADISIRHTDWEIVLTASSLICIHWAFNSLHFFAYALVLNA